MILHVDPIEALWFIVNAATLLFTAGALVDARRDYAAALTDGEVTGDARRLTARGNVRREGLRVVVQVLLISIVMPGLFTDRPITLSPVLVALILVPIVLLVSTVLDARDRTRLADMLLVAVRAERSQLALEASVQEGNELTREGIRHAEAAYHEANTVNSKIAALTKLVAGKEDKA